MFYVYLHRKKTTGEVFYVGKGKGKRIRDNSRRNAAWHNIVKSCGIIREYYMCGLQEWYALELEANLIDYYGRLDNGTGQLVNMLDSDERPAGRVYLSGIASPRADKAKHLFRNLDTGEEFSGTRHDFNSKYKPKKHFMNHLFIDKVTVSNGWIVVDRFSQEEYELIVSEYYNEDKRKDNTKYTFCNIFTGESVLCTRREFSEKFGITYAAIASYLNKAKQKDFDKLTIKREWYINEVLPEHVLKNLSSEKEYAKSKTRDKNKYEFLNLITLERFIGTRFEFKEKYNVDSVHLLKPGSKSLTLKGWCIPAKIDETTLDTLIKNKGVLKGGLNNPNVDKRTHTFINKNTGEKFNGTRFEFEQKYGFNVDALFSKTRQRKTVKGWSLFI